VATRTIFLKAMIVTRGHASSVVTGHAPVFQRSSPTSPCALHDRNKHASNSVEGGNGRLKASLLRMRGVKSAETAAVVVAGHPFIQKIRRGFYDADQDLTPPSGSGGSSTSSTDCPSRHRPPARVFSRLQTSRRAVAATVSSSSLDLCGVWDL
jgi:hypothetical protein